MASLKANEKTSTNILSLGTKTITNKYESTLKETKKPNPVNESPVYDTIKDINKL